MRPATLGALLALAPAVGACVFPSDQCDPGATRCNQGRVEACEDATGKFDLTEHVDWVQKEHCGAPSLCVERAKKSPTCVVSATKPDVCAARDGKVCDANRLLTCEDGWAIASVDCEAINQECVSDALPGCIPPVDPDTICKDGFAGAHTSCDGRLAISCLSDTLVWAGSCPGCRAIPPALDDPGGPYQFECGQALGGACTYASDCAPGLDCRAAVCMVAP